MVCLVISVSVVLVLGLAVVMLVRHHRMKARHAVLCVLFGFYLATTVMAPTIREAVGDLVRVLNGGP